jgi:O-antigen/teichoic acid export membrane protein
MPIQESQAPDALSTEHLRPDLRRHSVRGGVLTVTSQGAQFLIQSVSTVVLARLLTPADFGLVAMVSAITGLGQAFADLGLSEATIQRKDITHDQISALFWTNGAIGLALTLITAALAPLLAKFYREPKLIEITLVLSLTFLIGGLRVQADALLKRQMRFSSLAVRDIASSAIGVCVAIVTAKAGLGYWALVALPLTFNLIQMALSWLMVNWRPSLPRRDANVGSMIAFGGNVAASYFMMNVNRSSDNVLIGWHLGATPLGLYSRAYNLLMLPVRQLSLPITSVAVPAFSRIQGDPERFARYYLRATNLMMWISAPVFGFLLVAAQPVIILTLGRQWRAAAPVFQILVLSAMGQLLFDSTTWLFVSRGQSGRLLRLLFAVSPIIVGSFALGLPFGIKGVALSGSLVLIALLPWVLKFAFHGTTLSLRRLGRALLWPVVASISGVVVSEVAMLLIVPERIFTQLLVVAVGFALAFLLLALVPAVRSEVGSFKDLLSELRTSGSAVPPGA